MRASHRGRIAVVVFLALLLAVPVQAALLKNVSIKENQVEFEIEGPFTYTIYALDPYRVAVDLPEVKAGSFAGKFPSKEKGITEVSISEDEKASHLELLLESPAEVKPGLEGNLFSLQVITAPAEEPKPAPESAPVPDADDGTTLGSASDVNQTSQGIAQDAEAMPAPVKEDLPPATEITGISFEQGKGRLKLVITGDGRFKPNVFSLPDRIVMDIPGVALKAPVPKEVVSPVKGIRSGTYPEKVRLVIDMKTSAAYEVLASGDRIILGIPVEIPVIAAKAEQEEAPDAEPAGKKEPGEAGYTGQRISLDFQNADIVPIFMLLGEVSGYNVVVHPSVTGTVTLKLKDVPWDQALDLLLDTFSLANSIEGNIMKIAPLSQFAQWKQDKEKLKETEERTAELVQDVIKLNYAGAEDVSDAISTAKLLSPRGNITTDERMNTLIIKDTSDNIAKIRELVAIMDVAKPQVMIEAQIVEVNSTYAEELGVRWGGSLNINQDNDEKIDFSVNTPIVFAGPLSESPQGASLSGATLQIGTANALQLQLSLQALEAVGKTRKLANPRVLTIDNEPASIQQGTSIPVQTTTAEGTQTTYVNANLNLSVTPRITPEGFIWLKVMAANDSLGTLTPQGYAIDRKNVSTQALVKDGETLVLGGIYTNSETVLDEQVPLLGRIPVLGWLFKARTQTGPNPTELLILITPKVVKGTASAS